MHTFTLLVSASILSLSTFLSAQTSGPLRACSTTVISNGAVLPVYGAGRVGTNNDIQCLYAAGPTNATCFYDSFTYFVLPAGLPGGIPSDPNCWNPLPRAADAGRFVIQDIQGSVCLTSGGTSAPSSIVNGSPVFPRGCDGRHGYPLQSWTFDGLRIRQGDFCLDVTNGNTANGVKLQMWECIEGNVNQMWNVQDGDLLLMPANRFSWKTHPEKCVDLTNGDTTSLLSTQLWDCVQGNTNQVWNIKPM